MEQNISMQKLKEQRMSPSEKFVLDTIKGVKPNEPDKDGNVGWSKDGKELFAQVFTKNMLWINYFDFWRFLCEKHNLKYEEVQQIIKTTMYKYTNNGQLTPCLQVNVFGQPMSKFTQKF